MALKNVIAISCIVLTMEGCYENSNRPVGADIRSVDGDSDIVQILAAARREIDSREPCTECWTVTREDVVPTDSGYDVIAWSSSRIVDAPAIYITLSRDGIVLTYEVHGLRDTPKKEQTPAVGAKGQEEQNRGVKTH